MKRFLRVRSIWLAMMIISLMLSGCQSKSAPSASTPSTSTTKALPSTVGIGTHPVGGSFYAVGTGLAKVLSDRSPIKAIVKPSSGPNAFTPLLESGELGLGLESGNDSKWSYSGGPGYNTPYKSIRLLVRGNKIPIIPLVVRVDSGIKSIVELKGKRVATGYGGNIEAMQSVTAALESVGLTWNDVKAIPVADAPSAVRALQEGRVDAGFGATPTGPINIEINASTPLQALNYGDLPPEQVNNPSKAAVDALSKHMPAANISLQPKAGFLKADTTIVTPYAWLAASSKFSADAAYEITKTLYENDKELHPIHPLLKQWTQKTMFEPNPPAPYHEGAVRFWKEKGLWTPGAEENQKRLLGQ